MIDRLIAWCARNRVLTLAAIIVAAGFGVRAFWDTPLDAIPDLSDTQVIISTEWMGRSPDIVEDQVTYPIVTALRGVPGVQYVRGLSMIGDSFVYVVFKDGVDLYWARSRVLEYLSSIQGRLPEGVTPKLGPDATGVGWVFEYALVDTTGQSDLSQIRSFQDWYLRYWLQSVDGVSEVASVGGFVKQYQVDLDPDRLETYKVSIQDVAEAIRRSNNEVGGSVLEIGEHEHFVRGRGYIRSLGDLESIPVKVGPGGVPVTLRNLGEVHLGPEQRRGIAELDGKVDLKRVHFLGHLPYQQYLTVLQISTVHVYLTYPFVLSWSLVEAMAAGCLVIGSRSAPVEEVICDGENGQLVDFFDVEGLGNRIANALAGDGERAGDRDRRAEDGEPRGQNQALARWPIEGSAAVSPGEAEGEGEVVARVADHRHRAEQRERDEGAQQDRDRHDRRPPPASEAALVHSHGEITG